MKITKFKSQKGFSLVELLVVIVIVAILASLLLPALIRAKKIAEGVPDISNMKQLYEALIMYQSDENDQYPVTYNLVRPYTDSDAIFASKMDTGRIPFKDGKWCAVPFYWGEGGREDMQESDFKMSYGYLRNMFPDSSIGLFLKEVQKPNVGLFADPWAGDESNDGISDTSSLNGQSLAAISGSYVSGPVLRIQTDGSLYIYKDCDVPDRFGYPGCLFYLK